ncbi:MAG: glucose-6-phosphate isomerase [Casimicrobiaceae bacterium]|nr:glucose-6-phosphate isomerase [Casimicrobiaceae bacterium]MDW8313078.1 glucose-6-phosphate isomerase [Burkholderiales bacterium]
MPDAVFDRVTQDGPSPAQGFREVVEVAGIRFDFSREALSRQSVARALAQLENNGFAEQRAALVSGALVNPTERRPATHLRARDPAHRAGAAVEQRLRWLTRRGEALAPRSILHLGIGGSDLGVRLVHEAFAAMDLAPRCDLRFASGLDPKEWQAACAGLDPATTLVLVVSKSFMTVETRTLAERARAWLGLHAKQRLWAVTARPERAIEFCIPPEHIAAFEDSIGGRYSIWSAPNLTLRLVWGEALVEALLAGAHEMDQHFLTAPAPDNAPVLAALARSCARNERNLHARVVVAYPYGLRSLPAYLQQLVMESLGKRVDRHGAPLATDPCSSLWGGPGSQVQHSFFQWLHQHPRGAGIDLIVERPKPGQAGSVLQFTSAVAQAQALMRGFEPDRQDPLAAHRRSLGGRPSTFIALSELSPRTLGALLAYYEASVFVEACLSGVNPFDQFGVEFGKSLAERAMQAFKGSSTSELDQISQALLAWAREAP